MNNRWVFFANCKIIPENNFRVDSIDDYLNTLSYITLTGDTEKDAPQYIKHDLTLMVKVDSFHSDSKGAQFDLDFFKKNNNVNYMLIQNKEDSLPVYYFILKKTWTAQKTLTLLLKLDTVNTFRDESDPLPNMPPRRNNFKLSNRTLVNREHKDRFERINIPDKEFLLTSVNWHGYTEITFTKYRLEYIRNLEDLVNYDIEISLSNANYISEIDEDSIAWDKPNGDLYFEIIVNTLGGCPEDFEATLTVHSSNGPVFRKIDLYSEGLTPILYKKDIQQIESEFENLDWYLVYMNQNNPDESLVNPVNCYLCASDKITMTGLSGVSSWTPEDLSDGVQLIFLWETQKTATIYYRNIGETDFKAIPLQELKGWSKNLVHHNFLISKDSGDLFIKYGTGDSLSENIFSASNPVFVRNLAEVKIADGVGFYTYTGTLHNDEQIRHIIDISSYTPIQDESDVEINSIFDIDRTEPKLIKIIKLPYCPDDFREGRLQSGNWIYDGTYNMAKLSNLNSKFLTTIEAGSPIFEPLTQVDFTALTTETPKNEEFETKLFHSDYYQPKFVYDSFGFTFQLEKMSERGVDYELFRTEFVMTSTINSRFMFVFPQYICKELESQDYNNVMPVARNNEITLFNQQYINYLRTGFNYDVKSKERTEAVSTWGTVATGIGAVASFIFGGASGNAIGITAGIGLITSFVSQLVNTVNTVAQSEQNLEAKKTQLKNQSSSVHGSDDVDLMSYYTGNKAKLVLYKVSPKMRKALFNLFHYTGYISGEMKIPNVNTRTWFNFLSADLVFEEVRNIPDSCLQDLQDRYKAGITILHRHNGKYDFERSFENWETALNIPEPS